MPSLAALGFIELGDLVAFRLWAWDQCCWTSVTLTTSCNFENEQMSGARGVAPTLDSEEALHWEPGALVEDTQSPAEEDGTQAPCIPDQGHGDWEGQAEEGRRGGQLLCTDFGVVISLCLREQVLIYKRDRQ